MTTSECLEKSYSVSIGYFDMGKIAAAYIRVSTERQDEYSPASQLTLVRECAEREGFFIPDEYVFYDDGISGKSAKKRDAFNEMIALAKNKAFDRIYVWKFSRFARNQEESIVYKSLLQKKGVTVKSVSEPIPEGHFGSLIERIIEWMDEFYLTNLASETRRGMSEKISRGEPVVPPPFGYSMGDKKYVPDENADVVRDVFRRFIEGEKQRAIAVAIGAYGVRTKYGNSPDNRWIDYMLHNPCYIGQLRYTKDGSRAVSKRDYTNENIVLIDGHHEPIIDIDTWNQAQRLLSAQAKAYPKNARKEQPVEYMLKGLIRCSNCGATLTRSANGGLQCHNYARGQCRVSHSVVMPKIEAAFLQGIEMALQSQQFSILPIKTKKKEDDRKKLIALEEKKLQRAKDAYIAGIDSIAEYARTKADIEERIAELKKVPVEAPTEDFAKKVVSVVDFIKSDASPKAKNEVLRTIVENAEYNKPNETLHIFFHI